MSEEYKTDGSGGPADPTPAAVPYRQIRARYDEQTVTVYQAYSNQIADRALEAGTFVAPFSFERMTWIKPSFLWMMYRCGWARKDERQQRVLGIQISRAGFEQALDYGWLTSYDRHVYDSVQEWQAKKVASPVRIQWDPERSLQLAELPYRSIQIGLMGATVRLYAQEWVRSINDLTEQVHQIHELVRADELEAARAMLPVERPYPLPESLRVNIGAS
jgi:uncharacterized protein DUF4291